MRSLYVGVTLALVGAVSLALLAFIVISRDFEHRYVTPVLEAMDELELESARNALDGGGPAAAASYLKRLDQKFGDTHYLLNAQGTDVVSHESWARFLPPRPAVQSRGFVGGRFVVAHRSTDGGYWLLSIGPRKHDPPPFLPYLWVVLGVAAALCGLAAVGVVSPVRRLTRTIERFGRGDLSARSKLSRRDEIGGLARAFDDMADRIEGLLGAKRRLLQDISHELRSPLARLKLAVRLARTADDPNAALDRVERDIDRMAALTAEIVETVRMEGDPRALELGIVDLGRLVEDIVGDCRAETAPLSREIRVDHRSDVEIACDRELIRRAVENVLRNSVRHSPSDAPIDIAFARCDQDLSIVVRDYGPGVPDAALGRIFEPFFRVDEARASSSGGAGLGLSIASQAVRLHGGVIVAANAHPGLRVEIRLPQRDRLRAGRPTELDPETPSVDENKRLAVTPETPAGASPPRRSPARPGRPRSGPRPG